MTEYSLTTCNQTAFFQLDPHHPGTTGKGPALWSKMFHYYQYKREDFDAHYHRRSNIETVFSMVKMMPEAV